MKTRQLLSGPQVASMIAERSNQRNLGLRILIIGHDLATAESLATMFLREGHQVEVALGQVPGEASATADRPDIVLLELSVPGAKEWLLASQSRDGAPEKAPFRIGIYEHGQSKPDSTARDGLHLHLSQPLDRRLLVKMAKRLQAIIVPRGTRQDSQPVVRRTAQSITRRDYPAKALCLAQLGLPSTHYREQDWNMPQVQERRVDPRVEKSLRVLVLDPTDALEQPHQACLVNQSTGGVCLSLNRAIAIDTGSLLLFQVVSAYGTLPWVEVLVRNGRMNGHLQHVGCQFIRGAGWERMLSCG